MPEGSRRTFLGTAAALAALIVGGAAESADASEIVEDRTVTDDGTYSVTECGSVPSSLAEVDVGGGFHDGAVEVQGIWEPEGWSGVGVDWTAGPVRVGTGLEPDEARELADRLRVAADAAEGAFDE